MYRTPTYRLTSLVDPCTNWITVGKLQQGSNKSDKGAIEQGSMYELDYCWYLEEIRIPIVSSSVARVGRKAPRIREVASET